MEKKTLYSVKLDQQDRKKLESLAKAERKTKSQLIRDWIRAAKVAK